VVAAAVDRLKEKRASRIVIGESCIFGVKPAEAFRVTGMKEVSEEKKVELLDLDQGDPMEIAIPKGRVLRKIKVPVALKEFNFIVSVPVMKTHMHTRVTLSIKNMKGLLWRREKARFHQLRYDKKVTRGDKELDIAISEMASVLFPHLTIIDGTVGMEGMGPAYGRRRRTGVILVGDNALSTDAVAARLMGLDPETIPHLRLAAEKGWGKLTRKGFQSFREITRNGRSLLSLLLPNCLSLSRASWFMTRGRAAPAFRHCWSFFKTTIQNSRTIAWRIKTFISVLENICRPVREGRFS